MFALYHVYKDTPFHIIKKTLEDILREAAELLIFQTMALDKEYKEPNLPQISIHPQVPRLKGVNTLGYNKLCVCVCACPPVMRGDTVKHVLTSTSSPPNDVPSIPWSPVVLLLWTPWGAC
jgi:hypothetical protein